MAAVGSLENWVSTFASGRSTKRVSKSGCFSKCSPISPRKSEFFLVMISSCVGRAGSPLGRPAARCLPRDARNAWATSLLRSGAVNPAGSSANGDRG